METLKLTRAAEILKDWNIVNQFDGEMLSGAQEAMEQYAAEQVAAALAKESQKLDRLYELRAGIQLCAASIHQQIGKPGANAKKIHTYTEEIFKLLGE